jgi:propionyl-CoA carboxylase alpha chain
VTTNRDLLVEIPGERGFLAGATDTGYLERREPSPDATSGTTGAVVAAALAVQASHRAAATVCGRVPSGWRNNPSQPQRIELADRGTTRTVHYIFDRAGTPAVSIDGVAMDVALFSASATSVDVEVDGVRRRYDVDVDAAGAFVDVDSSVGARSFAVVPRFPEGVAADVAGSLIAPMPGTVTRVLVETGDAVSVGQPLVVLEAMKMEHTVASPVEGSAVELRAQPGQAVDAGTVLAVVEQH